MKTKIQSPILLLQTYFKIISANPETLMNDSREKIDKKFLFNENRKLRLELKQTKEVVKAHKDAINRLTKINFTQNQIVSSLVSIIMKESPNLQYVHLHLSAQMIQISKELQETTHRKNLLQKMIEEIEDEQQENYHLLVEDLHKMKKNNGQLQGQLHKFYEKIGEVDYMSGLVVKYKQLTNPKEQSMAFKKEQDQLLEFISLQKQTIKRLSEQKNKLLKINVHMKDQVERKKDDIRNMTVLLSSPDAYSILNATNKDHEDYDPSQNILDELQEEEDQSSAQCQQSMMNKSPQKTKGEAKESPYKNPNLSMMYAPNANISVLNTSTAARNLNNTLNFIKLQRQIIKQKNEDGLNSSMEMDSEDFDCPEFNILFPDKVQKIKKDRETAKVPYLNMMKIREMMAKKQSKIRKDVEAEAKHINPTQKIIKLQTELEITRKDLTNLALKFRLLEDNLKKLEKQRQQLENRNNILMRANQRYMHGYRNIYRQCVWGRKVWGVIMRYSKLGGSKQLNGFFTDDEKLSSQEQDEKRNRILEQLEEKILQIDPAAYILQLQREGEEDESKLKGVQLFLDRIFHRGQEKQMELEDKGGRQRSISGL